jgi:tetratricopeptide (TPR) repeat protein
VAAIPRIPPRALLGGGAVLILLGAALLTRISLHRETAQGKEARAFQDLLDQLQSPEASLATQAALGIPQRAALLSRPDRFAQAAALFSGERLRALKGEERLGAARAFWRGVILLKDPSGLKVLPGEVAWLRHASLAARAREESFEEIEGVPRGQAGPALETAMEGLVKDLFSSPAPPREALGALLWDRANLEEMAGMAAEALQSYRALHYDRVHDHWEFDGRESYLLLKADLLGRIRRRFGPAALAADPDLARSLETSSDPELGPFRSEGDGSLGHLLDGLALFHQGEPSRAAEELELCLPAQARGENREASLEVLAASRPRQTALLLRALARLEEAQGDLRAAASISLPHTSAGGRGSLELRRARLLAVLGLRDEFDLVAAELGRGEPQSAGLLSAAAETVWGDRERGAASLREALASSKELEDVTGWEELLARGAAPSARAYFEVGQLCDELGDLPRLERIIGRLEFAIEDEVDEAYVAFLRALVKLRAGAVVEAWDEMERLLERPAFPAGLSRRAVARFMEGAEEASSLTARAREILVAAARDLDSLRVLKKEIDPTLALKGSMALWTARAAAEAVDPAGSSPQANGAGELLAELREEIERCRPSYGLDRAWIDLQNDVARNFRDLDRSRKLDRALLRLDDLRRLLGSGSRYNFAREEASLRIERGGRLEAAQGRQQGIEDFRRAGELLLLVADEPPQSGHRSGEELPGEAARAEAARAFERAGDLDGVARAVSPLESTTRNQPLLLRYARALLAQGDLDHAREVLNRTLRLGEEYERVVEEPGDPTSLGGHHFRDPPLELTGWLSLHPLVDPLNEVGVGRLRYDPVRRTLEWRAPRETRFGQPAFLAEGEMARLTSGDDPRKVIFASPRLGPRGPLFPAEKGEWDLQVAYREVAVDPAQLEARLALAEAGLRLARLPAFSSGPPALAFCERHLGGGGSPRIREAIIGLVDRSLEELYLAPASREAVQRELARAAGAWRRSVEEEAAVLAPALERRREWLAALSSQIQELSSAAGDVGRVREILHHDIPQIHDRLRGFYTAVIGLLLSAEGKGGRVAMTLEELSRDFLDVQAREEILFLLENVGNRSATWQKAMALRGLQLERRAEEAARAGGDRAVLGPPGDAAALLAEAREVYQRLLSVSTLADGPEWSARAHLSLARLEARAGRLSEARRWLDRLADADLEPLGRDLLPAARAELLEQARTAAFLRADLARRAGEVVEAVRRYAEVIQRFPGSPMLLWAHLELGSCYESQGLPEEAYREYLTGKQLLLSNLLPPQALSHWLGGDRGELAGTIRSALPGDDAARILTALETSPERRAGAADREFWEQLFDAKLKMLRRQ